MMSLFVLSSTAAVSFAARLNRQHLVHAVNDVEGIQDASIGMIRGLVGAVVNISDPDMDHKCQPLWPRELDGEFTEVKAVGSGATACVFLGKDDTNTLVAIKVGKGGKDKEKRLKSWRSECEAMQGLRMKGCKAGDDVYALHQMYIPTCTKVAATKEGAYYVMHAGGKHTIGGASHDKDGMSYSDKQKQVIFAEFVASIWALHAVDMTHNDLHNNNACVDEYTSKDPHLALIDFGSLKTLEKSWKRGYKRDSNAVWRHGASLAGCPEAGLWPRKPSAKAGKAFLGCMRRWSAGESTFMLAIKTLVDGDITESPEHHIQEVYNSKFIQELLPENKVYYPWAGAGDCQSWTRDQWGTFEIEGQYQGYAQCDKVKTYKTAKTKSGKPHAHCDDGNDYQTACYNHIPGGRWRCGKCAGGIGKMSALVGCLFSSHPLYKYAGQ